MVGNYASKVTGPMDMKQYVRVGVRVRPPFEDELEGGVGEDGDLEAWRPAVTVVESGGAAAVAPTSRARC